ncbi:ketopantoate reductase family protein [SAR202 cluster bacterium AD-804-J14_MRT_500m]|nr:ketopantoate reductase family protein [SAR202 cluster bacterium AD-804-J14_MRT_500m]
MDRIAIMGGGAVGCYLSAFMTREGEDVTLIDVWPENIEAIKKSGIKVTGSQGPFTSPVKALHLHEVQSIDTPFDIIFIAMKSYDTRWASLFMEPHLKQTGFAVSSQNSINDPILAEVFGEDRSIGCIMSTIEVALWEPGHVTRGGQPGRDRGYDVFRVGELIGPVTPRVTRIVELVSSIDGAKSTTNLWGERWSKLASNCMGNPVGAMSGLGSIGMADSSSARLLKMHIASEVIQVGMALNYSVESVSGVAAATWLDINRGDVFEELDSRLQAKGRVDWHSSMAQDVIKGRRTEIDYLNGLVSRRGVDAGVPTPVNDAVVRVIHEIDAKRILPNTTHLSNILDQVQVPH